MTLRLSPGLWLALGAATTLAMAIPAGCGGGKASTASAGSSSGGGGHGGGAGGQAGDFVTSGGQTLASITVDPPSQSIVVQNGMGATATLHATAHFKDGTSQSLTSGVTWSADSPQVG